jgi:hypothetical protein
MNRLNTDKMNFYINKCLLLAGIILLAAGCDSMNDKHRPWLENGETIYIGKIDSLKSFAGDQRALFRYWISDPRVKTLTVSWALGKESLEIDVPSHAPEEPFEIYIGKNEKNIAEGNHTFRWTARDSHGNRSVVFENGASVYGQRYRSRLTSRPLLGAEAIGNDVTLTWGGMTDDDEVGIRVQYTTHTTETPAVRYFTSAEATSALIPDVKLTSPLTCQTLYLPEPTAIDTFATDAQKAAIQSTINVVLNKPVTHSDADPAANTGQMAVDGVTSGNPTRWVSNSSNSEHWIEVDLQGAFSINAFRMWRDLGNAAQRMKQFRLQAWKDGVWQNIVAEDNNEVAIYYKEFESITTDKVRLYIPPYTDNRARVFEIEVYSIIRF